MDPKEVKAYYMQEDVVHHYAVAVDQVGLWKSEELLFKRYFDPEESLLELGCGAGRITFGLHQLGYGRITAMDYSKKMVQIAREISRMKRLKLGFHSGDAANLKYGDAEFAGAIFGFNGLMQIPGADRRQNAMREIFRVIRPGSYFIFTTHDRENPKHRKYWTRERKIWNADKQHAEYDDFGDRIGGTPWGEMYIHIPHKNEVRDALVDAGFDLINSSPRAMVANESRAVRDFSDECLFWVAKKPEAFG